MLGLASSKKQIYQTIMAFLSGLLKLDLPFDVPLRYGLTLTQTLNRRLGTNSAMDPKDTYPGDYIRVTTLNAGTGLESPIIFMVGLHELFEEEQSLRLSDEEREVVKLDNTRRSIWPQPAGQR